MIHCFLETENIRFVQLSVIKHFSTLQWWTSRFVFFQSLISFDLHPGTGIHCIYNIHILCIYAVYIYIDTLYIYTILYICTYVYTCSNMCMSEFATEFVATWTQVNSWAEAILLPLQGVFMAQGRHLCGNPCECTAVNDMTSKEPASPKGNDMLDQFFRDGDGFRVYRVGYFHSENDANKKSWKKRDLSKRVLGEFFFLKVAVFQVVLVTVLFKGESLGSWTDDSWGNERLRTEKARQARIQFFQVKSGWISFSFKICFSSKDTENSHGIRWTSISALLSRLLLNGYHQQRSCISFGYDIPWICPRGRQSPPGLFRCIPCVFSFQTGLYQKQRHQSLPFNGTGATMPWLWCANTTQWGLSQNHVCLWTCWGTSTGGQRDSKYAKLGGIVLVGFFFGKLWFSTQHQDSIKTYKN